MNANEKIKALKQYLDTRYTKRKQMTIFETTGAIEFAETVSDMRFSSLEFFEKLNELGITIIGITQNASKVYTVFFQARDIYVSRKMDTSEKINELQQVRWWKKYIDCQGSNKLAIGDSRSPAGAATLVNLDFTLHFLEDLKELDMQVISIVQEKRDMYTIFFQVV